jgi:hypothetical protein
MRPRAFVLAYLLGACHTPTEPSAVVPQCTLTSAGVGPVVHLCYRPCPPGAQAFAAGAELDFTTDYLCT